MNAFLKNIDNSLTLKEVLSAISDGFEFVYHCPTQGCTYIAVCLDWESDKWGCGECGSDWCSREALFVSISEAIKGGSIQP